MQIPILLAIFEYGIILAMKKFWPNEVPIELKGTIFRKDVFYKYVDLGTFIISTVFLIIFNKMYWFA